MNSDLKAQLRELFITAAKVIFVFSQIVNSADITVK